MTFEEWLESDATKEFRGLLAFDRKAKELANAAWLASREAAEQGVEPTLPGRKGSAREHIRDVVESAREK